MQQTVIVHLVLRRLGVVILSNIYYLKKMARETN